MIHLQGKLPKKLYVACSGGVDSMGALNFLQRKHDVTVLHFDHGTEHASNARIFLEDYCTTNNIQLRIGEISNCKPKRCSNEEWWRNQRYAFFDQYTDAPVVTGHHLDDCVETWIWSSMHGTGKWIPYTRKNVIRPFRLTKKDDFKYWCVFNNVPWIEDDSNKDTCYTRNYIRYKMMPHVLQVNPGIFKVISKKVKEDCNDL